MTSMIGNRSFITGIVLLATMIALTALAVAAGKASFVEAAGFLQWAIPSTLGLTFASMKADKFAEVRRENANPVVE